MTKKILILGSKRTSKYPKIYYEGYQRFFMAATAKNEAGYDVKTSFIDDLIISVGAQEFEIFDCKNQVVLKYYDVIFIRGSGLRQMFDVLLAISVYSQKHGVVLVNDYSKSYDFSKLSQAVRLTVGSVAVPQTVYVTSAVLDESGALPFSLPCVMKDVHGAHGDNNHIVESKEQMRKIASACPHIRFVLQQFVPNDGDLRIVVLGEQTLVIRRKANDDSHLNNTSKGGSAELVPLDEVEKDTLSDALLAADILNLTCAGVDIIIDTETNQRYVLEVNSQPQLHTGASLDAKNQLVAAFLQGI